MANQLRLLIPALAIFALNTSAQVFLSIDCGSDSTSIDKNSIKWMADDGYIKTGQSLTVDFSSGNSVMDTMRLFTSHKKNCYSLPAEKGGKVLVRASFYYGDYDNKNLAPKFDLLLDGNHWTTVYNSLFDVVSYEAIYVPKKGNISVCVAQTHPDQIPFISALEVRSLGPNMYSHLDPNFAMFNVRRLAAGANFTVRYPSDPYDRIWQRGGGIIFVETIGSQPHDIKVNVEDDPPQEVLENGITSSGTLFSLLLLTDLPAVEVPIYMTLYFSEVLQLNSTEDRSMQLFVNKNPFSKPFSPPFGSVLETVITNISASSNTSFSLQPTSDATLPPLINAFEVYNISSKLTDGTNSKDIEGLVLLQSQFEILQEWSGDPCLPAPFTWDWVECSLDATPRVTALFLSGYELSGMLPNISSMDALQIIDLHNNTLTGPVPDFLATLSDLKQLNLAENGFSGNIPASLLNKKSLNITYTNYNSASRKKTGNLTPPTASPSSSTDSPFNQAPGSDTSPSTEVPLSQGSGSSMNVEQPVFLLEFTILCLFVLWGNH